MAFSQKQQTRSSEKLVQGILSPKPKNFLSIIEHSRILTRKALSECSKENLSRTRFEYEENAKQTMSEPLKIDPVARHLAYEDLVFNDEENIRLEKDLLRRASNPLGFDSNFRAIEVAKRSVMGLEREDSAEVSDFDDLDRLCLMEKNN